MLNIHCVRQSPPASQICVVSYLVAWLFSLFRAQCTHAQSNPFYPDVTHVPKIPDPLPLYCTESDGKLGGAWERGYYIHLTLLSCVRVLYQESEDKTATACSLRTFLRLGSHITTH